MSSALINENERRLIDSLLAICTPLLGCNLHWVYFTGFPDTLRLSSFQMIFVRILKLIDMITRLSLAYGNEENEFKPNHFVTFFGLAIIAGLRSVKGGCSRNLNFTW